MHRFRFQYVAVAVLLGLSLCAWGCSLLIAGAAAAGAAGTVVSAKEGLPPDFAYAFDRH